MKNETLKLTFDEVETAYKIDNAGSFMYRGALITKENCDTFLVGLKEKELTRGEAIELTNVKGNYR